MVEIERKNLVLGKIKKLKKYLTSNLEKLLNLETI